MKMLQNQGETGILKSVKKKWNKKRISLHISEISLAADKEWTHQKKIKLSYAELDDMRKNHI